METQDIELYRKCEDEVSAEHPFYCLCGKIATGLHEMCYAKFRQAVERRYNKVIKGKK